MLSVLSKAPQVFSAFYTGFLDHLERFTSNFHVIFGDKNFPDFLRLTS